MHWPNHWITNTQVCGLSLKFEQRWQKKLSYLHVYHNLCVVQKQQFASAVLWLFTQTRHFLIRICYVTFSTLFIPLEKSREQLGKQKHDFKFEVVAEVHSLRYRFLSVNTLSPVQQYPKFILVNSDMQLHKHLLPNVANATDFWSIIGPTTCVFCGQLELSASGAHAHSKQRGCWLEHLFAALNGGSMQPKFIYEQTKIRTSKNRYL